MSIEITKYAINDSYTVRSNTDNISSVIDKMIRLSAKLTERFASDIVYDLEFLNDAVKNGKHYDKILFFRENGVATWPVSGLDEDRYDMLLFNFTPIQTWRLIHDPEIMLTKLERVEIFKNRNPWFVDNNTK